MAFAILLLFFCNKRAKQKSPKQDKCVKKNWDMDERLRKAVRWYLDAYVYQCIQPPLQPPS